MWTVHENRTVWQTSCGFVPPIRRAARIRMSMAAFPHAQKFFQPGIEAAALPAMFFAGKCPARAGR